MKGRKKPSPKALAAGSEQAGARPPYQHLAAEGLTTLSELRTVGLDSH